MVAESTYKVYFDGVHHIILRVYNHGTEWVTDKYGNLLKYPDRQQAQAHIDVIKEGVAKHV